MSRANNQKQNLEKRERIVGGEVDVVSLTVVMSTPSAPECLQLVPLGNHRVTLVTEYQRGRHG